MSIDLNDPALLDYSQRPPRHPEPVDPANDGLPIPLNVRTDLYKRVQELRQFEKRAYDLFMQNLVKGTSHLSLGMEAVSAGFAAAMQPEDYVFATYRGHAHTLSKGADMGQVMAELLGRENGLLKGKGGSMHLTHAEANMMGSYAIIGAHLCIANGTAWSAQMRGTDQVTVCFFGDGTTNIGAFHEALNFAKVWNLPVVFVCENNLYMEYTPIDLVAAVPNPAADRAPAYGLESIVVDGNDPDAVYMVAADAITRARRGEGPALVEAQTYRHGGHSRADPGKYRPADEVEAWLDRDPIPMYHQRLLRLGVPEGRLSEITQDVARRVDEATEFAKAGAHPGEEHLFTDVWADGGSAWRN
ncbi:MAG: thiamine pyrophosphate-dependent dehydrogenase E1 component subunit alpha [Acidimicrobiia bacterium]|nr:thiamine pyrophosphate-dependent dehydrogenase E1 component subunit alpha [Acidimicrobiia bacterium]MDH4307536.1 thiamine pyrophosphate-dependent dehydrogenase E1 component subunit alpha [Acidimicrobiia bacterium]MDH5292792.1 thiamine pyrophosphate-dependent dehydrogenase E1 component subunit alpha [Acidimicrobiia bacterium]